MYSLWIGRVIVTWDLTLKVSGARQRVRLTALLGQLPHCVPRRSHETDHGYPRRNHKGVLGFMAFWEDRANCFKRTSGAAGADGRMASWENRGAASSGSTEAKGKGKC